MRTPHWHIGDYHDRTCPRGQADRRSSRRGASPSSKQPTFATALVFSDDRQALPSAAAGRFGSKVRKTFEPVVGGKALANG